MDITQNFCDESETLRKQNLFNFCEVVLETTLSFLSTDEETEFIDK